ncbi:hypothetical protein AcidC75_03140 [Acidisoma sp. C75]
MAPVVTCAGFVVIIATPFCLEASEKGRMIFAIARPSAGVNRIRFKGSAPVGAWPMGNVSALSQSTPRCGQGTMKAGRLSSRSGRGRWRAWDLPEEDGAAASAPASCGEIGGSGRPGRRAARALQP